MNADYTSTLLKQLNACLQPAGFKRRGQLFERQVTDVVHLVQLQKSQSSNVQMIRVTLNLAIWVPAIAPVRAGVPDKPSEPGSQWRERIGFAMPIRRDTWWDIESASASQKVAEEMCAALIDYGVPRLNTVSSSADLLDLWRGGMCTGLTAYQRDRFMAQLGAQ
jgi:hypothetical protein